MKIRFITSPVTTKSCQLLWGNCWMGTVNSWGLRHSERQ